MKLYRPDLREPEWEELGDITTSPVPTFWRKWLGGATIPLLLTIYATKCWVLKTAWLPGRRGSGMPLYGEDAIVFGFACLFIALVLHFHLFWTAIPKLEPFSFPGKVLSLLGLVVSLFLLLRSLLFV